MTARRDFFLASNMTKAILPKSAEEDSYAYYDESELIISKVWLNFFNKLVTFFVEYDALPFLFYNKKYGKGERITVYDKLYILKVIIKKTLGFSKLYERMELKTLGKINNETCLFTFTDIPLSIVEKRIKELSSGDDKYIARFTIGNGESSRGKIGFFAPRIKVIYDRIRNFVYDIISSAHFVDPTHIEYEGLRNMRKQLTFHQLNLTRIIRYIDDRYILFLEPIAEIIDNLDSRHFSNNDDALHYMERTALCTFSSVTEKYSLNNYNQLISELQNGNESESIKRILTKIALIERDKNAEERIKMLNKTTALVI